MNKYSIDSNCRESAPSGLTPFVKSTRKQLQMLAAGCVATGGVAAILLPGVAQSPAIVPVATEKKVPKASFLSPLPGMEEGYQEADEVIETKPNRTPTTRSIAQEQKIIQKISIDIRGAKVTDLLAMVAMQAEVDITISSDVDEERTIPYVRLNNVTPEQAISKIVPAAGLSWNKQEDGSFFVGKAPAPSKEPERLARKAPIYGEVAETDWNDMEPVQRTQARQAGTPFPELRQTVQSTQREARQMRPIRTRNVRPGILAWWIDPSHQEVPYEFARAASDRANDLDRNLLRPAVDPDLYARMNNPSAIAPTLPFASPYVPGAYVNPYASPAAYTTALQPTYQSNRQIIPNNGQVLGPNGQVLQPGQTLGPNGQILQNGQVVQNNGFNTGGGTLNLPEGIDQLVAIDAQNIILVYGTAEAVQQLQTIIDYLDRPVRQVEIEAQFIDVSVNELRGFGVQFFNGPIPTGDDDDDAGSSIGTGIPGANQLTISYGQYRAQLSLLAQSGNSRIISSPRVTTMNNLSATLQSSQTTPIVLTSSTGGVGGQVAEAQQAFSLTTSVGIQVTPTILNDDTITVFVTPQVQTQAPTPGLGGGTSGTPAIPTVLSQSLTTVANVKDNDVIVLGGLRTRSETIANTRIPVLSRIPIIGILFQSRNKTDVDRELVIFLTARIYRRTNDVVPLPGP